MTDASGPAWIRPVPNVLTVLRIVAAAALPFVPAGWRLPVVVFAGLSDLFDGVIARRFHAESAWGALMDGIADKLFVLSAVITFVAAGDVPLWQGLLVMTRDLVVSAIVGWTVIQGQWSAFRHMQVRLPGKLTTALVIPWFATLLIPAIEAVRPALFVLAAVASVVAAVDYWIQFMKRAPEIRAR